MRVLLVDDEKEFVSTLSERLGFRGIESDWATSAEDAQRFAGSRDYDLAVLDVKMPGTGGLELKKKLTAVNGAMRFIFLTGHGSEDDFKAIMAEGGAQYYLVKPIQIDELVARMREIMES